MSTTCVIGKLFPDGQVKYIYCHAGGPPDQNGVTLLNQYMDSEKVDRLLDLGGLSTLGEEIGEAHGFDETFPITWCNSYKRDRLEKNCDAVACDLSEYTTFKIKYFAEYMYLFCDGNWYVNVRHQNTYKWVQLETFISLA